MINSPIPPFPPKISVIIPAYNQADFVAEAVHSVLNQTCPDFELLVVNDGSTDRTAQVVAGIDDPRLRVIWQPNAGLSAARNTGIRESTAPLVTFLDADDYFFPDKLELLSNYLDAHPEVGLVSGGVLIINKRGEPLKLDIDRPASLDLPFFLSHNPFSACAVMVRRSWIDRVGPFDESLRACEDWELWHRMLRAGCQFAWIERPVVTYRYHAGQMTRESERMRKAIFRALDKFYAAPNLPEAVRELKNQAYASSHVTAAVYEFFSGDYEGGRKDLEKAIELDPALSVDRYRKLVSRLTGWTRDPRTQTPTDLLDAIIAHPPDRHPAFVRELRRARADVVLSMLFSGSRADWAAHRKDLLSAVWHKPEWLLNRGVLRRLAYAWLKI